MITIMLACTIAFAPVSGEQLRLITEGSATGPVIEAEAKAIQRAEEAVIFEFLDQYIPAGNYTLFKSIVDRRADYVVSSRVMKSNRENNSTRVELETYLDSGRLKTDMAALLLPRLNEPPRFMVLLSEQIADAAVTIDQSGFAELALIEAFKKADIEVELSDTVRAVFTPEELLAQTADDADPAAFALDDGSDIAVIGKSAVTFDAPPGGSNVLKANARISLRVFELSSAKMVESLVAEASVNGVSPKDAAAQAMRDAATKLVNDVLIAGVLATTSRPPYDGIDMIAYRLNSNEELSKLVDSLKNWPGVGSVDTVHYSRLASRIQFRYSGPIAEFSDWLGTNEFDGFYLRPQMVVGNEMVVTAERN